MPSKIKLLQTFEHKDLNPEQIKKLSAIFRCTEVEVKSLIEGHKKLTSLNWCGADMYLREKKDGIISTSDLALMLSVQEWGKAFFTLKNNNNNIRNYLLNSYTGGSIGFENVEHAQLIFDNFLIFNAQNIKKESGITDVDLYPLFTKLVKSDIFSEIEGKEIIDRIFLSVKKLNIDKNYWPVFAKLLESIVFHCATGGNSFISHHIIDKIKELYAKNKLDITSQIAHIRIQIPLAVKGGQLSTQASVTNILSRILNYWPRAFLDSSENIMSYTEGGYADSFVDCVARAHFKNQDKYTDSEKHKLYFFMLGKVSSTVASEIAQNWPGPKTLLQILNSGIIPLDEKSLRAASETVNIRLEKKSLVQSLSKIKKLKKNQNINHEHITANQKI